MIDRRRFLLTSLAGVLVGPLAAGAQQAARIARIAFLSTTSSPDSPTTAAFRQGLQELGYIEGQNIIIEWRWGGGRTEEFPAFASEVVRLNVDVIVAANDAAGRAAQQATKRIPIVIAVIADPVGSGFVNTLARPGGNITGLSMQAPELAAKRLQFLKEAVPHVSRVALLADTNDLGYRQAATELEAAAQTLGVQLRLHAVRSRRELNGVFATMVKEGAGAVFLIGGTMFYANRAELGELALKSRLPMMCGPRETMHAGCLISYSAALTDRFRRAAYFVDKILKGAKPADMPVEQPTRVPLVIDLKTAKAFGLTIPPSLLARADQIIE
jgi:putative tryptophan/tyrosine transport system substrate-binding protein